MKTINCLVVLAVLVLISGCGAQEAVDSVEASVEAIIDPTEGGLCWVAIAIFASGAMRAIFNK